MDGGRKMNQIGRIKLMTRSLTPEELGKLSKWMRETAMKRSRQNRIKSVVDLGVGGRVVYCTSNSEFDVAGRLGTIKKITKNKKGMPLFEVEFDDSVWTQTTKSRTKEFWDWCKALIKDPDKYREIDKQLRKEFSDNGGWYWYKARDSRWNKYYEKVTGKKAKETEITSGHILVRIGVNSLLPATDENIKSAQRTREQQPMMNQLNKMLADVMK